ncbi:MAG: hypothetical protein U0V03_07710 [Bacteroidia bacterium]
MKKQKELEVVITNIERHLLFIMGNVILTGALFWLVKINVLKADVTEVNPFSFFLFVPLLFFGFQTLWIFLTPFALLYKDRIEFKNHLLSNKVFYLVDLKDVSIAKNGSLKITYHDGDIETVSLLGIKTSHRNLLLNEIKNQIKLINI